MTRVPSRLSRAPVALVCFALFAALFWQGCSPGAGARIGGLENQHPHAPTLALEIRPVVRAYYEAVAAGDFEAALGQMAWGRISTYEMGTAQDNARRAAALVKRQIDANGGLRQADLLGVFMVGWAENPTVNVVTALTFGNGKTDISASLLMLRDGPLHANAEGPWRFEVKRTEGYIVPPVVGMEEAVNTLDAFYRAALEGSVKPLTALSYIDDVGEGLSKKTRQQRQSELFTRTIERIQKLVNPNGGLVDIEVVNMSQSSLSITRTRETPPVPSMRVEITRHYGNGKHDSTLVNFAYDKGHWLVQPASAL